jgi:FecR protein
MLKQIRFLALSSMLMLPLGLANAAGSATPGTVNYVEGQVSIAGQPVTPRAIGSAQLQPNQVLQTGQGRAEMLLTPGVFLRLGENSSVRLISPNLGDTRVELLQGRAIVEVTEIFKDNNLRIMLNGSSARLDKEGLYSFDAEARQVQVFDGEATVDADGHSVNLKKDRQLALMPPFKTTHFDAKVQAPENPLYAWSNLRSEYEAEASMQSARNVFVGGDPYWYGAGWYWNPYWDMYGFIPGDGIWYSAFGWPFYSPWLAYSYGGYGFRGYGYGHGYGHGVVAGARHISGSSMAARSGGFAGGRIGGGGYASHGFAGGMHGGFGGGGGHR